MDQFFNVTAWREILGRAFQELGANIASFIPNVIGAGLTGDRRGRLPLAFSESRRS